MQLKTQVLIVGAGPTGLTAAFCLKRQGIDCLLIDKRDQPTTTSNAAGVHAETMRLWHEFGVLDKALEKGLKATDVCAYSQDKQLFDISFKHINSPYPFILLLPQFETEKIMRDAYESVGGEIHYSHDFQSLQQNSDGVVAQMTDKNGESREITAEYVIAADGYHTRVREATDIVFKGIEYDGHFAMMDVPIKSPHILQNQISLAFHPSGLFAVFPMQDFARVVFEIGHDPEFRDLKEPTIDAFVKMTEERFYLPIEYGDPTWSTMFYVHEGLVDKYRDGRVFLAGDAAHVHSPAGGQGMNLGIQDAYCLTQKLGPVLRAEKPATTLDEYEALRRPKAEKVVKFTSKMLEGANLSNPFLIKLRNTLLPFITKHQWVNNQMATTLSMIDHKVV